MNPLARVTVPVVDAAEQVAGLLAGGRRRVRSAGGKVVRRMGLLPGGVPDGLGDDDALRGTTLDADVLVFFGDTAGGLYQLRPWLPVLGRLHEEHRVLVVTADSRTARALRQETTLPVVTVARYATLDDVLSRSRTRLALYVNHNPENFSLLRFTQLVHVYLGHGDSDKAVSVSNQVKAYDYCFVAGEAAVERLAREVPRYDAAARCVVVGQPFDAPPVPVAPRPDGRRTVLYAPTWEGAQPSVEYSSVVSHGADLVASLLADPRLSVVYRPHPLTGVRSARYAEADAALRAAVARAAHHDPAAGHRVDTDVPLAASFAAADVLVADVSGVVLSWLPSARPFVVTRSASPATVEAATRLTLAAERLDAVDAADAAQRVERLLDAPADRYDDVVRHYFAFPAGEPAVDAFLTACRELARA